MGSIAKGLAETLERQHKQLANAITAMLAGAPEIAAEPMSLEG
jgi:hypothetical protein